MDAKQFQAELHRAAFEIGERSEERFLESVVEGDWPDEESTTGGLFGVLVEAIKSFSEASRAQGG